MTSFELIDDETSDFASAIHKFSRDEGHLHALFELHKDDPQGIIDDYENLKEDSVASNLCVIFGNLASIVAMNVKPITSIFDNTAGVEAPAGVQIAGSAICILWTSYALATVKYGNYRLHRKYAKDDALGGSEGRGVTEDTQCSPSNAQG